MRIRILVLVTAVLLFGAIVTVPRIIEASKSSAAAANAVAPSPVQGRRPEVTVGESIRNDTSPPVREMKQQPVFKPRKEANANPKIAHPHKDAPDRVVQTSIAANEFTAANRIPMAKLGQLNTSRVSTRDFRFSIRQRDRRCLDHQASRPSGVASVA